jgi:hypothetical protein
LTFASDFAADYAIAFGGNEATVYQVDADGKLLIRASANVTRSSTFVWELDFPLAAIGIAANSGAAFKYIASHIQNSSNASRSNEFQGVANGSFSGGNIGTAPASLATGDYNTFQTVPEPSASLFIAVSLFTIGMLHRPSRQVTRATWKSGSERSEVLRGRRH